MCFTPRMRERLVPALLCIVAAGCSGMDAIDPDVTSHDPSPAPVAEGAPGFVLTLDDAVAVNLASRGTTLAVAWTTHDEVRLGTVDIESGGVDDVSVVSGDIAPVAHPIERPALAIGPDGDVDVAFTSHSDPGTSVYLSRSGEQPEVVSGAPRPETNLVHMTYRDDGAVLSWLEDSTLSVARDDGSRVVETESVDDSTCDCCNPVPVFTEDSLVVVYRDLDRKAGEIVRNVAAVRSVDGGFSFEAPVPVADEDWFITGCPFTGPAGVDVDGTLVVAWMDARQTVHPDQSSSSIWVDRSVVGSTGFGTDFRVTQDGRHRWPTMAVDDTARVHLFWETPGEEGGLSYAVSTDTGATFSEPSLLVDRALSGDRAPQSPSVVYHHGYLVLSWAAGGEGYVAGWDIDG